LIAPPTAAIKPIGVTPFFNNAIIPIRLRFVETAGLFCAAASVWRGRFYSVRKLHAARFLRCMLSDSAPREKMV
jgi:hypothetical protein